MDFDPRDYADARDRDDDRMYGSWLEDPRDRDERDRDVDPRAHDPRDRVLYVWQQLTSEVKDRAAEVQPSSTRRRST